MLMALLQGCASSPNTGLDTVRMQVGSKTYTLEIAETNVQRVRGLMERDTMPRDRGMIFLFPSDRTEGFWMKNTRIPLDILYIDQAGKVVSVRQMKPYDLSSYNPDGPYRYAIELNAGQAQQAGVAAGSVIAIPAEIVERAAKSE